jgi:hypothetical protein
MRTWSFTFSKLSKLFDELFFEFRGDVLFECVGDRFKFESVCERVCNVFEEGALFAAGLALRKASLAISMLSCPEIKEPELSVGSPYKITGGLSKSMESSKGWEPVLAMLLFNVVCGTLMWPPWP